jgi:hypothetical protein
MVSVHRYGDCANAARIAQKNTRLVEHRLARRSSLTTESPFLLAEPARRVRPFRNPPGHDILGQNIDCGHGRLSGRSVGKRRT